MGQTLDICADSFEKFYKKGEFKDDDKSWILEAMENVRGVADSYKRVDEEVIDSDY